MNAMRNLMRKNCNAPGYGAIVMSAVAPLCAVLAVLTPGLSDARVFSVRNPTELVAAINMANNEAAYPGPDVVVMRPGIYTLYQANNDNDGLNGLPSVSSNVTLQGRSPSLTVIERSPSAAEFRIAHVAVNGQLTLKDLTIRNGVAELGGGIYNRGLLTAENTTISSNAALTAGTQDGGGGISNRPGGTVKLVDCQVLDNTAQYGDGGGLVSKEAPSGEGSSRETRVEVTGSNFQGNFAGDDGGAMSIRQGTAGVATSSFYGNEVLGDGGAFAIENNDALLRLDNCTVARNLAAGDGGGFNNEATLSLENSTIVENSAGAYGSASGDGGGVENHVQVMLSNTILAFNSAPDKGPDYHGRSGSINTSLGNNLVRDPTLSRISFQATDIVGEDPRLDAYREGPVGSGRFPLLADSPAIDTGSNDLCAAVDQIGMPRPLDGDFDGVAVCDMGAVEFLPVDNLGQCISTLLRLECHGLSGQARASCNHWIQGVCHTAFD